MFHPPLPCFWRPFYFWCMQMNLPTLHNGMIGMPQDEFEQLLEQAATRDAKRVLAMSAWKAIRCPRHP
ncbi:MULTISPECIES: hypothetical protein [Nitrosomonas]|uniref:hypothetical protein n=1 Tax=Nitrosomonas TaxID=914 RepID=UPI001F15F091|nr:MULTISPECIES: hypothetical protein [Nitrosomonas]UVS63512.1 hypothetical protein NX761_07405 [Nitrosomonas sp. PLL12]